MIDLKFRNCGYNFIDAQLTIDNTKIELGLLDRKQLEELELTFANFVEDIKWRKERINDTTY